MSVWNRYREEIGNDSLIKNTLRYDGCQFTHIYEAICDWTGNDFKVVNEEFTPKEVLSYLKDKSGLVKFVDEFLNEYRELIEPKDEAINVILEYFDGIQNPISKVVAKDLLIFMEDLGMYIEDCEDRQ